MKRWKSWISGLIMAAFITGSLLGTQFNAWASAADAITLVGQWQKDEAGWKFQLSYLDSPVASRWGVYNDHYYFFGSDGYMRTGWNQVDGSWYYLNVDRDRYEGARRSGWLYDEGAKGWFYLNSFGVMVTGWHKLDGAWYYFHEESDGTMGKMAADTMVDGSYLDSSGRMNEDP